MNFDSCKEILNELGGNRSIDTIAAIIDEIQKNSESEASAINHLILRDKYFSLIQSIIEIDNEILVKYVFNWVQKYCLEESECRVCSMREKSQFMLNILRYIQHTEITNEIIKLEIFKFFLNNYELIEKWFNAKILSSIVEICINQYDCENKFIKSSSKTVLIKYIAVLCNQITLFKSNDTGLEKSVLDAFLVSTFLDLLNKFNKEEYSFELRCLILECIELLLNNLLIEQQVVDSTTTTSNNKYYHVRENPAFIEFAWQSFCPSILFQFGDCGLPTKVNAPQSIQFKQIYGILIQLTGLVGGCKAMISVFEAIFQRILFYPPEQDKHLLLKLFKTYVNKSFILSLTHHTHLDGDSKSNESKSDDNSDESKSDGLNEFTLVNLIVAFYRNCYEKSNQPQNQDRILQLLACECINSYIMIIYDLYSETRAHHSRLEVIQCELNYEKTYHKFQLIETTDSHGSSDVDQQLAAACDIKTEAERFIRQLDTTLLKQLQDESQMTESLDFLVKQFCLELIRRDDKSSSTDNSTGLDSFQKSLYLHTNQIRACVYMSLYVLIKSSPRLNQEFELTSVVFDAMNPMYKNYFIHRCMIYYEADIMNAPFSSTKLQNDKFKSQIISWLCAVYDRLMTMGSIQVKFLHSQLKGTLDKLDSVTKLNLIVHQTKSDAANLTEIKLTASLVKKLIKNSWTYLVDVLVGFLLNTNLSTIENLLFMSSVNYLDMVNNTEFSLTMFALRSCIDSLDQLVRMICNLTGMGKELGQLFFLLLEPNYSHSFSNISLNRIICLDFILFSTSHHLLGQKTAHISQTQLDLLWKYLIESIFFCFSIQANSSPEETTSEGAGENYSKKLGKLLLGSLGSMDEPKHIFQSIHFDINKETITLNRALSCPNESETGNGGGESSTSESSNQPKSQFVQLKCDVIFQSLFRFLNKADRRDYQSKLDLIDQLAACVNQGFFVGIIDEFVTTSASSRIDFVFKFCATLCDYSKVSLLDNHLLRARHRDYLTFNSLLMDKIEEILTRLVGNVFTQPSPSTTPAFVFTEVWTNIFVCYFKRIFKHQTTGIKEDRDSKSRKKLADKKTNQSERGSKSSFSFIIQNSSRRFQQLIQETSSSLPGSPTLANSNQAVVVKEESTTSSQFSLDLTIYKKLVYICQKLLELYINKIAPVSSPTPRIMLKDLLKSNHQYDDLLRKANTMTLVDEDTECVTTASDTAAPADETHFAQRNQKLLDKLDAYREYLDKMSDETTTELNTSLNTTCNLANDLFYSSTTSIFISNLNQSHNEQELKRVIYSELLEQNFNINSLLLVPVNCVLRNKYHRKQTELKNLITVALCELVESNSYKVKSAWPCIFNLLSRVDLKETKRKIESDYVSSGSSSDTSDLESLASSSSLHTIESSEASTEEEDENELASKIFASSNMSFKYDSIKTRFNSILNMCHIFLNLAESSDEILASGSFCFVRCVTGYLQYKNTSFSDWHYLNYESLVHKSKQRQVQLNDFEDDEDLYVSTNDSVVQELQYEKMARYDRLVELSDANDSSSHVRPFLICLEKYFTILTRDNDDKKGTNSMIEQILNDKSNHLAVQLDYYDLPKLKPLSASRFVLDNMCRATFPFYDFKQFLIDEVNGIIEFEHEQDLIHLDQRDYTELDDENRFKMLVYTLQRLYIRSLMTHDELNSVQIVQLVYDLLNRMLEKNKFKLLVYCLLQVVMRDFNILLDSVDDDLMESGDLLINEKLANNKFFLHSMIHKQIVKIILVVEKLWLKISETDQVKHYLLPFICILGRLNYLLARLLVKRISQFNSAVELDILDPLKILYLDCLNSGEPQIIEKCLHGLNMLHLISLIPFVTLFNQYGAKSDSSESSSVVYANLEVLTKKCRNVWELYVIKKSFKSAKGLLYYDRFFSSMVRENSILNERVNKELQENQDNSEESNVEPNLDEFINEKSGDTSMVDQTEGQEEEYDADKSTRDSENNFYRVFTLKYDKISKQEEPKTMKNIFGPGDEESGPIEEQAIDKQVNLSCFIEAYKFHLGLVHMIKKLTVGMSLRQEATYHSVLCRFLQLLNRSYMISVRMDQILPLKILLSKIFYLNYENSLANFICLTKSSFITISFIYTSYILNKLDLENVNIAAGDGQADSIFKATDRTDLEKIVAYFPFFIQHASNCYYNLNSLTHFGAKLDLSSLEHLFQKPSTVPVDSIQETLNKFKEINKVMTMKRLADVGMTEPTRSDEMSDGTSAEEINSSSRSYLQKDSQFRYQVWSNQMLTYLVLSLGHDSAILMPNMAKCYSDPVFFKSLAHILAVLNSCSTYCQCSSFASLDLVNSSNLLKRVSSISIDLLHYLLNRIK